MLEHLDSSSGLHTEAVRTTWVQCRPVQTHTSTDMRLGVTIYASGTLAPLTLSGLE